MSTCRFLTSFALLLLTASVVAATGGRLCFTRGHFVFVREPNGRIKCLVEGYDPSISPDGRTIAFIAIKGNDRRNLDSHVKLVDIQTGVIRGISTLDALQSLSSIWSPDGRYLAVDVVMNNKRELATVNLATGEICVIPTNFNLSYVWLNSWGADNTLVLNALENVYQIGLDGHVVRKLSVNDLFPDLIASDSRFSVSNDGKFLLFNSGMVPDDVGIASIYLYDLQNGRLSRLTPDNLGALKPRWLPSGKEIIFAGYVKGRYKPQTSIPYWGIYKISVDGKTTTKLVANGENPSSSG